MTLAAVPSTAADWLGPIDAVALFRLLVAAVLGALVGWERERHGRAAGLRTHMLLCLGCALVMLVSLYVPALFLKFSAQDVLRVDPGRVAAGALSGLGFLGAGAILVLGGRIRGLTTAASIWVTAALGLAVGAGYLVPALFAWLLAIIALVVVGDMERKMELKDRYVQLRVHLAAEGRHMGAIRDALAAHGMDVTDYRVNREGAASVYEMTVHYETPPDFEEATAALTQALSPDGLNKLRWH